MSKAKERCITYFRSLHSQLQVLSKEDLKGTRIDHGFKRAFMSLFGQDADTFTSTMLLNGEFNTDFHPMVDFIAASPLRCNLKLRDEDGIVSIPDTELFENLTPMGYNISQNQKLTFQKGQFSHQWKYLIHTIMQCLSPKSTGFNEFSSNIATALVCLATNRTYNFSKMIFDGMVKNVRNKRETDKIGTKRDKNEKRGEAGKSQEQSQSIKQEKLNKTQKERPKMHTQSKCNQVLKKRKGLKLQVPESSIRGTFSAKDSELNHCQSGFTNDKTAMTLNKTVQASDGENLNKMKEKGDECIFVGYSNQSRAYRVFNKRTRVIMESIHVNFDELPLMASDQNSSDPAPECQTMASDQNSSDPAPECQTMASDQNSSDPAPECQTMASDQLSSDPTPKCQTMASYQNSSDPAPECQTMASDQNSSDPAPECQTMASDQNSSDPAPECQTMTLNHDSLSPAIQRQENVPQADTTVTTSNELDLLFSLMFDELLNGSSKVVSKYSAVSAADAPNQRQ
nr:ribonuclease H-like domain-containing protein [Tanacetum cinerariifolium]